MPNAILVSLAATGLIAAVCTSDVRTASPGSVPSNSIKPFQTKNINVTNLYNDTCSKCHGINGQGGGGGTQTFLEDGMFDQKNDRPYFDAIKNGVPQSGMDAYGETMNDQTVWSMVVHIRELQGKAWRARKGSSKADANGDFHTKLHDFKVDRIVESGLKTPWAIDWLPGGTLLVTNRSGTIVVVGKDKSQASVDGLPNSVELGQGGLMDVAVHPNYATNGWVYLSFSDPKKGESRSAMTKIVRGKIVRSGKIWKWTSQETVFEADQKFYTGATYHFGSRIVFDGNGHVFFNVGERGGNMLAQKIENHLARSTVRTKTALFQATIPL